MSYKDLQDCRSFGGDREGLHDKINLLAVEYSPKTHNLQFFMPETSES